MQLICTEWKVMAVRYRWEHYGEDICLQTSFCYLKFKTLNKELFVLPANGSPVGILIKTGDVKHIFAMRS